MSTQKKDTARDPSRVGKTSTGNIMASRRGGNLNQSRHGASRSIFASGVSRTTSGSRKSVDVAGGGRSRQMVHVMDDYGQDITPLPLLAEDKKVHDASKETPTEMMSQGSIQHMQMSQGGSSGQGQGPVGFTRSRSQMSSSLTRTNDSQSDVGSEDIGDHGPLNAWPTEKKFRQQPKEILTEEDLEKTVNIELVESETFWMFDQPPALVSNETEDAVTIRAQNEKYEALLQDKIGNDKYSERGMNTFDNHLITKSLQTDKISLQDMGVTVTTWDMYDSYQAQLDHASGKDLDKEEEDVLGMKDAEGDGHGGEAGKGAGSVGRVSAQDGKASPAKSGKNTQATTTSMGESELFGTYRDNSTLSGANATDQARNLAILRGDAMQESLFVMERAIVLNNAQSMLSKYRGLPLVEMAMTMEELEQFKQNQLRPTSGTKNPNLQCLWRYTCSMTKGRNISSLCWNHTNPDILAAGYGQHDYSNQKSGVVACWSVKNIQYPERIWQLPCGVTALDWSHSHPSLLAVGMYDGVIYVFDARRRSNEPVINTHDSPGRHLGPIRQLEWVVKDGGKAEESVEVLVSISSDGRVTQWSLRKGFEHSDLMKLKRVTMKVPGATIKSKDRKTDALISRFAFGTSISFNPSGSNIYLAGTEDGHVHKCSCSYNEQYMESYSGHTGPVYGLKWSPFAHDIFLSCAADWTIKLWHIEHMEPIINFQSAAKSVNALCWSPRSSVIYAVVNDGALEIWNLASTTLDPIITEHNLNAEIRTTSVLFAKNSDSILVGDSEGNIHVYKLENMPTIPKNQLGVSDEMAQSEALDRVVQASLASRLHAQ